MAVFDNIARFRTRSRECLVMRERDVIQCFLHDFFSFHFLLPSLVCEWCVQILDVGCLRIAVHSLKNSQNVNAKSYDGSCKIVRTQNIYHMIYILCTFAQFFLVAQI